MPYSVDVARDLIESLITLLVILDPIEALVFFLHARRTDTALNSEDQIPTYLSLFKVFTSPSATTAQ